MMWWVLAVLAVAIIALTIGIRILVRHNRVAEDDALTLIPGQPTSAPRSWARGHDPEARLHRRMREALANLRNADLTDGGAIDARVRLELAATDLDNRLIAVAPLPPRQKEAALRDAAAAVGDLEAVVGGLVTGAPDAVGGVDRVVAQLSPPPSP